MDIEQVCRTCLNLNGPFLSIFEANAAGNAGCIAEMIKEFTNNSPVRTDNLPGKVCLSCISEINHCYSFKLKCENSLRTLCQLLPNAAPEQRNEANETTTKQAAQICHQATQTSNLEVVKPHTTNSASSPIKIDASATLPFAAKKRKLQVDEVQPAHDDNTVQQLVEDEYFIELHEEAIFEEQEDQEQHDENLIDLSLSNDAASTSSSIAQQFNYEDATDAHTNYKVEHAEQQTFLAAARKLQQGVHVAVVDDAQTNILQSGKIYKCNECNMYFSRTTLLRKHLLKRHDIQDLDVMEEVLREAEEKEQTLEDEAIEIYEQLLLDDAETEQQQQQKQQTTQTHKASKAVSSQCHKFFDSKQQLLKHKTKHLAAHVCHECNEICNSAEELSDHQLKMHQNSLRQQCELCQKVFTTLEASKNHSCDKPDESAVKKLSQKENLKNSVSQDNAANDKEFKCADCFSSYDSKTELLSHRRIHTGEHRQSALASLLF